MHSIETRPGSEEGIEKDGQTDKRERERHSDMRSDRTDRNLENA